MGNLNRAGSLGMLALGLGVGAALAATPIASAGTLSADGGAGALGVAGALADLGDATIAGIGAAGAITPPTLPADYTNFAISFSGISLYHSGTATAWTTFGNFAIARGDQSYALATHGMFNSASADGDHSLAYAGGSDTTGLFNSATASGTYSVAEAALGASGGNGNVATSTGDFAQAYAGSPQIVGVASGDFNSATAQGTHTFALASFDGSSNNVASAVGDNATDISPDAGSGAGTDWWGDLWHLFS